MAHANYDAERDVIEVHTVWNEKPLIQAVPGAKWDVNNKTWYVPTAWASVIMLRGVFGTNLSVGDSLVNWAWTLRRTRIDPAVRQRVALEPTEDDSPAMAVIRSWR